MDFIFEQNEDLRWTSEAADWCQDLTFPEFMDIVLDLRSENAATATWRRDEMIVTNLMRSVRLRILWTYGALRGTQRLSWVHEKCEGQCADQED